MSSMGEWPELTETLLENRTGDRLRIFLPQRPVDGTHRKVERCRPGNIQSGASDIRDLDAESLHRMGRRRSGCHAANSWLRSAAATVTIDHDDLVAEWHAERHPPNRRRRDARDHERVDCLTRGRHR